MSLRLVGFLLLGILFFCSCVSVEELPERGARPATELPEGSYYTVSAGDTFYKIGKKFDVDWKKIAEVNGMDPTAPLLVGQKLIIPESRLRQEAKPPDKADDSEKTAAEQRPKRDSGVKYVAGEDFIAPVKAPVAIPFRSGAGGTTVRGVEFSCATGTEVKSSRTGVVLTVFERFPGFGRVVIIDHGYGFATFYGYLGKIDVRDGDVVKKGEAIGKTGVKPATGKGALHFRIYKNWSPVNPAGYIK